MEEVMEKEGDKDVVITYDTLFELVRREKDRGELQKLEAGFFNNVLSYLREKNKIMTNQDTTLFSFEEKKKTEKHLENAKRILKELYNRREKKIIELALNKSRTESSLIYTSNLTEEEKQLFYSLVFVLEDNRKNILTNLLEMRKAGEGSGINAERDAHESNEFKDASMVREEKREETTQKEAREEGEKIRMVRFLHSVPRFVGPELQEYGPFEEEDVASLPEEIANVLVNKGRAEVITQ